MPVLCKAPKGNPANFCSHRKLWKSLRKPENNYNKSAKPNPKRGKTGAKPSHPGGTILRKVFLRDPENDFTLAAPGASEVAGDHRHQSIQIFYLLDKANALTTK